MGSEAKTLEQAIRETNVDVGYINSLLAQHSSPSLQGQTLQRLAQQHFGTGRDRGLPLNGFCWVSRAIGEAFDTLQQALGKDGRAFYFYA